MNAEDIAVQVRALIAECLRAADAVPSIVDDISAETAMLLRHSTLNEILSIERMAVAEDGIFCQFRVRTALVSTLDRAGFFQIEREYRTVNPPTLAALSALATLTAHEEVSVFP